MFKKILSCFLLLCVLFNLSACLTHFDPLEKTTSDSQTSDAPTVPSETDEVQTQLQENDPEFSKDDEPRYIPSAGFPMSTDEMERFQAEPVNAMYRSLLDNYKKLSKTRFDRIIQFAIIDWNQDGMLDLLLNASDVVLVIYYGDLAEKELRAEYLYTSDVFRNANRLWCHFQQTYLQAYWYDFSGETVDRIFPIASTESFSSLNFANYDSFLMVCHRITGQYNTYKLEAGEFRGVFDFLFDCPTQEDVDFSIRSSKF